MPKITDQRKRDLDAKVKREQELKQKLEDQRSRMDDIMNRMDQATRNQISSSTDAARARRRKDQATTDFEAELEVQDLAIKRLEKLYNAARKEREEWEAME